MSIKTLDLLEPLYEAGNKPVVEDASTALEGFEDRLNEFKIDELDIHFMKILKDTSIKYQIELNTSKKFSINIVDDPKTEWRRALVVEWDEVNHQIITGPQIKTLYNKVVALVEDQTKMSITDFTYNNFDYMN